MRTSSKSLLLRQQHVWAMSGGPSVDARGYVNLPTDNLWRPLSPRALAAFKNADGSELRDGPRRPAKMRALHSSSALAVNFFDYWSERDTTPLLTAFGLDGPAEPIVFEKQFPTGLEGNPPNLDLAIKLASGTTIAIESKFSEWLTPKSLKKKAFKPKYFPSKKGLWAERGLPACQALANEINLGHEHFRFLDAPQLLKHSLGLVTELDTRFALYYVFFDWACPERVRHYEEISRFLGRVGRELQFRAITYQELFDRLVRFGDFIDPSYLNYLRSRYFANAA